MRLPVLASYPLTGIYTTFDYRNLNVNSRLLWCRNSESAEENKAVQDVKSTKEGEKPSIEHQAAAVASPKSTFAGTVDSVSAASKDAK